MQRFTPTKVNVFISGRIENIANDSAEWRLIDEGKFLNALGLSVFDFAYYQTIDIVDWSLADGAAPPADARTYAVNKRDGGYDVGRMYTDAGGYGAVHGGASLLHTGVIHNIMIFGAEIG